MLNNPPPTPPHPDGDEKRPNSPCVTFDLCLEDDARLARSCEDSLRQKDGTRSLIKRWTLSRNPSKVGTGP